MARNISFEPVSQIRRHIEMRRNLKLRHRGEAHITILTPPEYNQIREWNPSVNMNSINRLVGPVVQYLHFNVLGIGSVKGLNTNNEISEVFFLVVRSRGLRAIRKLIAAEWSIPKKIFDPMQQDFHITIGFTVSDLFSRPGFEVRKRQIFTSIRFEFYVKISPAITAGPCGSDPGHNSKKGPWVRIF